MKKLAIFALFMCVYVGVQGKEGSVSEKKMENKETTVNLVKGHDSRTGVACCTIRFRYSNGEQDSATSCSGYNPDVAGAEAAAETAACNDAEITKTVLLLLEPLQF